MQEIDKNVICLNCGQYLKVNKDIIEYFHVKCELCNRETIIDSEITLCDICGSQYGLLSVFDRDDEYWLHDVLCLNKYCPGYNVNKDKQNISLLIYNNWINLTFTRIIGEWIRTFYNKDYKVTDRLAIELLDSIYERN